MKKLMLFGFILMMLVVTVSGAEWDNIKSYDADENTITISNSFLKIFPTGEVAEITLITPQVHRVIYGPDRLVAQFQINSTEDYEGVFKNLEFYDLNFKSDKIDRAFTYRYAEYYQEEVIEYQVRCFAQSKNGSESNCKRVESGSRFNEKVKWTDLDKDATLPRGVINIGIFTDVQAGDHVEWIPTLFGVRIPEWAEWTDGLNDELILYFNFENGTSNGTTVFDQVNTFDDVDGVFNLPSSVNENASGIIGNGIGFTGNDDNWIEVLSDAPKLAQNWSVNAWFFMNETTNPLGMMGRMSDDGITDRDWRMWLGDGVSNPGDLFDFEARDTLSGLHLAVGNEKITNAWVMITVVHNISGIFLYENGSLTGNASGIFNIPQVATFKLSWNCTPFGASCQEYEGFIDEVGYWNRSLTDQEISDLYNGGLGITFISNPGNQLIVNLSSPVNNTQTTNTSLIFNTTLAPRGLNLTNATLNIWYFENDTIFNETTNTIFNNETNSTLFDIGGFPLGSFKWNVLGCAENISDAVCEWAEENFTFQRQAFAQIASAFENDVFETSFQSFELNISTIPAILSVTANLVYNGSSFLASTTCDSGICNLRRSIDIPLIDSTQEAVNKSFFWEVIVFDGTSSVSGNSTSDEQNVTRIHLETCDATFNVQTFNFTAFDEQNITRISPFTFAGTFKTWLGSGTTKRNHSFLDVSAPEVTLCLTPNNTIQFADAIIDYSAPDANITYPIEDYNIRNATISNISNDIPLFLLASSSATTFIIQVQDVTLIPIEDALVFVERFYPGEGLFRTIQLVSTDQEGKTVAFFETETVLYKFIVVKDGVVLLETSQQKIVGEQIPFTIILTTGEGAEDLIGSFTGIPNLFANLSVNKTTGIVTYTYIDVSGLTTDGRLFVFENSQSGSSTGICNITSSQASATLICNTTGFNGTIVAQAFITQSPEQIVATIVFAIDTIIDTIGDFGLFIAFFIILVAGFALAINLVVGVIMIALSVVLVNLLGLVSFGSIFVFAVIAIAIIIVGIATRGGR